MQWRNAYELSPGGASPAEAPLGQGPHRHILVEKPFMRTSGSEKPEKSHFKPFKMIQNEDQRINGNPKGSFDSNCICKTFLSYVTPTPHTFMRKSTKQILLIFDQIVTVIACTVG